MRINLKDFRQSHNLFQSDMAEILQVNQSNVSRAEIRGFFDLTYPQKKALYEKFGQEDVDSFIIKKNESVSFLSNNNNEGNGTQNNGIMGTDSAAIGVIREQSLTISKLAEKQAEQTDRLLVLLEKLSEKL